MMNSIRKQPRFCKFRTYFYLKPQAGDEVILSV
jgi:hypothetical protein